MPVTRMTIPGLAEARNSEASEVPGKLGTSSLKKSHRWPTCWTLPTKRLTYHKVAQAGPPCVLNTTMLS